MADSVFDAYPSCSWTAKGKAEVVFPVVRIEEEYRNRIAPHERYKRDGARLDDTGSKARVWRLTIEAYNSRDQEEDVKPLTFYPDELNKLLDSFSVHETGDLVVSTRGPRRCRAEGYTRVEESTERDAAAVVLTFIEDNEDDASAAAWQAPSAMSVVASKADDAARTCSEAGFSPNLTANLREMASALESYANGPSEYLGDLERQATTIQQAVQRVEDTYNERANEGMEELYTLLTDPRSSRAGRALRALGDAVGRAVADKATLGPRIVTKILNRNATLFGIATDAGVALEKLLELNPSLDPFNIPAGTPFKLEE